jgi:O-antigen/teichoic acid export membrane protein
MLVGNLLNLAMQFLAARLMAPAAFGGLGSLLALSLVGLVPGIALQPVAARHASLAARDTDAGDVGPGFLRFATLLGGLVGAVALAAAPVVGSFLHVPVAAACALALSLAPYPLISAAQGVLQGRERFGALATALTLAAGLRFAGTASALALRPTITSAMLGLAIGTAAAGMSLLPFLQGSDRFSQRPPLAAELRDAALGMLALLVLTNLDLVLARHYLTDVESGRYAVGALAARGAFWAPQFVAVLALPRLATADTRRLTLRKSMVAVMALGFVEVGVAAALPPAVLRLMFGRAYGTLAHTVGLFAAVGATLAVTQLLLYSSIAARERRVSRLLWGAVAVEIGLVAGVFHASLHEVVMTAFGCAAAVAVAAAVAESRATLGNPMGRRDGQWPAASQSSPTPTDTSSGTDSP